MESHHTEKRSWGSFSSLNTLGSRLSQLTQFLSFGSRAEECLSMASRGGLEYKWILYKARQEKERDLLEDRLQEAYRNDNQALIKKISEQLQEYDGLDYNDLDGHDGKIQEHEEIVRTRGTPFRSDTMRAHGTRGYRNSFPEYSNG